MRNIAEMTSGEILAEYNQLTGKDVKKFSDRTTAMRRLLDARNAGKEPVCPTCGATEAQSGTSENTFVCHKCGSEHADGKVINRDQEKESEMKTATKRTAKAKVASGRKAIKPKAKGAVKPKSGLDRSKAISESWGDAKTRKARSTHNGVKVGGTEYRSVKQAFEELKLPLGKHISFRAKLKKEGAMTFDHEGKKFNFKIVE